MDIFLDLQYGNFKFGSFNRLLNISLKYINQECVHTVNQSYKNYKNPPNLNIISENWIKVSIISKSIIISKNPIRSTQS